MVFFTMNIELLLLSLMVLCKVSLSAPPPVVWLGVDISTGGPPSVVPVRFCFNCSEANMDASTHVLTVPAREVQHLLKYEPSLEESPLVMNNSTLRMMIRNEAAHVMKSVRQFARSSSNVSSATRVERHHRQKRSISSFLAWTSEFVVEFVDQIVNLVFCDPNLEIPTTLEEVRSLTTEQLNALSCKLSIFQRTKLNAEAFVDAVTYLFTLDGARDVAKRYVENISFYQIPDLILNIPLIAWRGTFLIALPLAIEAFNNNPGGDARDFVSAAKLFFLGS